MSKTAVLYARVDAGLVEWVRSQAEAAGLSMTAVIGLLLAHCRQEDLTVHAAVRAASTPGRRSH